MPIFLAFILLLLWAIPIPAGDLPGTALVRLAPELGARVVEVRLNLYATLNHRFESTEDLGRQLGGLVPGVRPRGSAEPLFRRFWATAPDGTRFYLESVRLPGLQPGAETLLVADRDTFPADLAEDEATLATDFIQMGQVPTPEVTVVAVRPGQLNTGQRSRLLRLIWARTGAHPVEGVAGPSYISIAGFKPGWSPTVLTAGRRLNLQVAISYNGYGQRTEIRLGSPLVGLSY